MNCLTFESHINELARERVMEAATRERACAHASGCARCAARLADERALTAGLRSLAGETRTSEAPQRVESALLASFRAQHAATSSSPTTSSDASAAGRISSLAQLRTKRWFSRHWAVGATGAAAAIVLLVFGLTGGRWQQTRTGAAGEPDAQASASPSFTPSIGPAPIGIHPSQISAALGSRAAEIDPMISEVKKPAAPTGYAPRATAGHASPSTRYRPAGFNRNVATRNAAQTGGAVDEIATDFIPLTHGNNLGAEDGGQVMRVELPRSALVSFGLPMNAERAGERIKADVLMGEDGVARAIRFVR